jgi:hypothetical protein
MYPDVTRLPPVPRWNPKSGLPLPAQDQSFTATVKFLQPDGTVRVFGNEPDRDVVAVPRPDMDVGNVVPVNKLVATDSTPPDLTFVKGILTPSLV